MKYYYRDISLFQNEDHDTEITSDQCEVVKKALYDLGLIAEEIDFFSNVQYNVNSFISLDGKVHTREYGNFVILNSHFSNWLNSFYTWKCFHNHYMNDSFSQLQKDYRIKEIVYQLADCLRNYTAHTAFAISSIQYNVIDETYRYLINSSNILDDPNNMNSKVRNWLVSHPSVDAMRLTHAFWEVFVRLQSEVWQAILPKIEQKKQEIADIITAKTDRLSSVIFFDEEHNMDFHLAILKHLDEKRRLICEHIMPQHY